MLTLSPDQPSPLVLEASQERGFEFERSAPNLVKPLLLDVSVLGTETPLELWHWPRNSELPPLLMIPGFGMQVMDYLPLIESYLAQGMEVLAVNPRGQGDPPRIYGHIHHLQQLSHDLLQVSNLAYHHTGKRPILWLDHLAIVAGLEFALTYPKYLSGLVLVQRGPWPVLTAKKLNLSFLHILADLIPHWPCPSFLLPKRFACGLELQALKHQLKVSIRYVYEIAKQVPKLEHKMKSLSVPVLRLGNSPADRNHVPDVESLERDIQPLWAWLLAFHSGKAVDSAG
jgi:hypothetical protein